MLHHPRRKRALRYGTIWRFYPLLKKWRRARMWLMSVQSAGRCSVCMIVWQSTWHPDIVDKVSTMPQRKRTSAMSVKGVLRGRTCWQGTWDCIPVSNRTHAGFVDRCSADLITLAPTNEPIPAKSHINARNVPMQPVAGIWSPGIWKPITDARTVLFRRPNPVYSLVRNVPLSIRTWRRHQRLSRLNDNDRSDDSGCILDPGSNKDLVLRSTEGLQVPSRIDQDFAGTCWESEIVTRSSPWH